MRLEDQATICEAKPPTLGSFPDCPIGRELTNDSLTCLQLKTPEPESVSEPYPGRSREIRGAHDPLKFGNAREVPSRPREPAIAFRHAYRVTAASQRPA
jgi:hypothetical protein